MKWASEMTSEAIVAELVELDRKIDEFEAAALDPMKCEIVNSPEEMDAAVERHKKAGRRLAAVSNAGLKDPQRRLTFLPESAFSSSATERKT